MIKYMAVAVAVAVSGRVAVPVAVPVAVLVAGLTKRFLIKKISRKNENSRRIARMARNLMIFGPSRSGRRELKI